MPNQFMEGLEPIDTDVIDAKLYIYDGDDHYVDPSDLALDIVYGSVWGNEIAWAQASAVQNTWYIVTDADMADGQLNKVTHDGDGQLTVLKAAIYHCTYTISLEADAANQHVQITFCVDGTETNDGIMHIETFGANRQHPAAGVAIFDLSLNSTVEVSIRTTDAGTPDILVDHLNIAIHELR